MSVVTDPSSRTLRRDSFTFSSPPWLAMLALALVWLLNVKVAPDNGGISDLPGYRITAQAIADGQWPYRDFFFEYPPLAAGLFVVGGWIGGLTDTGFLNGIAIELLAFALVAQVCAARLAPKGREQHVAWMFVALPLLMGTLVRERFDIAPMAICILGVLLLAQARHRSAFMVLGAGIALKLFPLVVVLVGVAWLVARGLRFEAWSGLALSLLVALAIFAPFFAVSPHGFTEQFRFHLDRPVQIESTPASTIFLLGGGTVVGTDEHPSRFRSQGFVGGPSETVKVLFEIAEIAAMVLLLAGVLRATRAAREPERQLDVLVLGALGALLAFAALGKVFSVQYMIWLAPFAALAWVRGSQLAAALIAGAYVLTAFYYPHHYFELVFPAYPHNWVVFTVALRNALLVGALGAVLHRLWRPGVSSLAT